MLCCNPQVIYTAEREQHAAVIRQAENVDELYSLLATYEQRAPTADQVMVKTFRSCSIRCILAARHDVNGNIHWLLLQICQRFQAMLSCRLRRIIACSCKGAPM